MPNSAEPDVESLSVKESTKWEKNQHTIGSMVHICLLVLSMSFLILVNIAADIYTVNPMSVVLIVPLFFLVSRIVLTILWALVPIPPLAIDVRKQVLITIGVNMGNFFGAALGITYIHYLRGAITSDYEKMAHIGAVGGMIIPLAVLLIVMYFILPGDAPILAELTNDPDNKSYPSYLEYVIVIPAVVVFLALMPLMPVIRFHLAKLLPLAGFAYCISIQLLSEAAVVANSTKLPEGILFLLIFADTVATLVPAVVLLFSVF